MSKQNKGSRGKRVYISPASQRNVVSLVQTEPSDYFLQSLTVENFMQFEEFTLDFNKPAQFTIFVGNSNTGKTSMLLAIRLFYHIYSFLYDRKKKVFQVQQPLGDKSFNYATHLSVRELFYKQDTTKTMSLTGRVGNRTYQFQIVEKGAILMVRQGTACDSPTHDPGLSCFYISSRKVNRYAAEDIKNGSDKISATNFDSMLYAVHDNPDFLQALETFYPDLQIHGQSTTHEHVLFRRNQEPENMLVHWDTFGTGCQQILVILAVIFYGKTNFKAPVFLFDEPNNFLYGGVVCDIYKFLTSVMIDFPCQIILSTHSLDYLDQNTASIVNFNKSPPDRILTKDSAKQLLEEFDALVHLDGFGLTLVDMFRKIIIVEAADDEKWITQWLERIDYNESKKLERALFLHSTTGPDEVKDIVSVLSSLSEKFKQKKSLSFFVIRDRDYAHDSEIDKYTKTLQSSAQDTADIQWHIFERVEIENYVLDEPVLDLKYGKGLYRAVHQHLKDTMNNRFADHQLNSFRSSKEPNYMAKYWEYMKTVGELDPDSFLDAKIVLYTLKQLKNDGKGVESVEDYVNNALQVYAKNKVSISKVSRLENSTLIPLVSVPADMTLLANKLFQFLST